MKGYSIIELIISLFVIAIAALIFSLSINQAVASFSKSSEKLIEKMTFFSNVTSNFAGKSSGTIVNTLDKILGYDLSGSYAFFDAIEVRQTENGYVYSLKDTTF